MQYIRSLRTPFALFAVSAVVACSGGDDNRADSALATDTAALNRDINLAGTDTAAQPALTDVPAGGAAPAATTPTTSGSAARPSTTTRRPTPTTTRPSTSGSSSSGTASSGSSSSGRSINAGYTVNARSDQRVCTNTIKVGDTFTATVYETVSGTGTGSIPEGATITLRVTEAKRGENVNDEPVLKTDVQSITINGRTYTPSATVVYANVDKERASTRGNDAKKVVGGAIIGAVAGQVLGKDTRSTVTGAAAGAAAGTAAAVATANSNACIGASGRIQVRVDESMAIRS